MQCRRRDCQTVGVTGAVLGARTDTGVLSSELCSQRVQYHETQVLKKKTAPRDTRTYCLHFTVMRFCLCFCSRGWGFPFRWTPDLAVFGHSDRHERRGGLLAGCVPRLSRELKRCSLTTCSPGPPGNMQLFLWPYPCRSRGGAIGDIVGGCCSEKNVP